MGIVTSLNETVHNNNNNNGLFKGLDSGLSSSMGLKVFKYQHLPIGVAVLCPAITPVKEQGCLGGGCTSPVLLPPVLTHCMWKFTLLFERSGDLK